MTSTKPLQTANSVMSAAPTSGARVVLLDSGSYPGNSSYGNGTWTFNGGGTPNWTLQSTNSFFNTTGSTLPTRIDSVSAFDGTNVMMYGGRGASGTDGTFQDTWLWESGTTWVQASPSTVPFSRYNAQCAYLAGTGVVMFGGESLNGIILETWIWNGSSQNWSQVSVANGSGPAARTGAYMAASSSQVLLFGGQGTSSQFNDVFSFNGTAWSQVSTTTAPSVRSNGCMSYDTLNSKFVLFGGENEYYALDETWVSVNGSIWTQVPLANGVGPSARIGGQMCFDATSNKTLLFGGIDATTGYPSNDSWLFDGSALTWTAV